MLAWASNLQRVLLVTVVAGLLVSMSCEWMAETTPVVAPEPAPAVQETPNEPRVFPTWSALVIGPARGQLEPCGCSGGQLGGIDRLATVLAMTPPLGTPTGPRLAAGGAVALDAVAHPTWAKAQAEVLWQAYSALGFDAIGLASSELPRISAPGSREEMAALLGSTQVVASNLVEYLDGEKEPSTPSGMLAAWKGEGVTMLSFLPPGPGGTWPSLTEGEGGTSTWKSLSVSAALRRLSLAGVWSPSEPTVAFFEGTAAEAAGLAERLSADSFVLLVADEFEASEQVSGEGAQVLEVGSRLRQVLRLSGGPGLAARQRVHQQRVSESVPADPAMGFLRGLYRMMLQVYDARGAVADSRPNPGLGGYVGSESCAGCHEDAYAIWEESLHHHALETLEMDLRDGVAASIDPRCVSCHVVGFGEETGFGSRSTPEETRWTQSSLVANVGCESCHGPGGDHVVSESPTAIERGGEYTCLKCHDAENDPHFVFEERWANISHQEGDF